MKFSIITPCRNAERYLRETMDSVLTQRAVVSGRAELEYLICDGASSDGTLAVAESCRDPRVCISSGRDNGMYDALTRGLRAATGDVVAYLNAGDVYYPTAFDVVDELMRCHEVHWLTGYRAYITEDSVPFAFHLPFRYRRRLFECGAYGKLLPSVQQEGTFWRRALLEAVDLERLSTSRLAGDYLLWQAFSSRAALAIASTFVGAFRTHRGQQTERSDAYLAELRSLTRPMGITDLALSAWDALGWLAPTPVQKWLSPPDLFFYDPARRQWVNGAAAPIRKR